MCGIAGIIRSDGGVVEEGALRAMAASMSHRGPDASGIWIGEGLGFAHTRLSLFDLSDAANQPWTGEGDSLVFNGEIYNFVDLRRALEVEGCVFHTSSDTEVLFTCIQTWGIEGALDRIRGMFAFAFHDASSATTYLCRDRYGIKPLHYVVSDEGIMFASEVKAMMVISPPEVDELLALMSLRTLGDKFQTRTLFRGVRQVAPGSVVEIRDGRTVSVRDYSPLLDVVDEQRYRDLDERSFDGVCAELGSLLEGAIDRMAVCDAKLGVFLSGGVDSSLIAAVAAAQGHGSFRAFTSDVRGPSSERSQADEVARSLGIPLHASLFEAQDWASDWVRATWHLETPVITNPSTVPFARVALLAHNHGYKAVLTGEGSDELFLGYPRLASGGVERLAGAPVAALRRLYRRVPGLVDAVLNERDSNSYDFLRGIAGGFEDADLADAAKERYGFLDPRQAGLQAASVVMVQTSLQALLQRNDRMGMSASIESRFPFLDEEVVAFALNLPARWKLRRSRAVHDPKHPFVIDKAPIRAIAESRLDPEVASRRKNGFPTPGLRAVAVRPGAFADSWSAEAFGAGRSFDRQIAQWRQPYDVAKLMSVEIFGRLFGWRQALDEVEGFVSDTLVPS